jgi:hypothetical protein
MVCDSDSPGRWPSVLASALVLSALVVGNASAAQEQPCESLDAVEWMLGDWTRSARTSEIRETWRRVSDDTFEGESITTSTDTGEVLAYESLRLVAMSDGVFYIAKVAEHDLPVPFRLTQCTDTVAVFEDPEHDAPDRLIYDRSVAAEEDASADLLVTLEGDAMKTFTLRFTRTGPAGAQPGD